MACSYRVHPFGAETGNFLNFTIDGRALQPTVITATQHGITGRGHA